MEKRVDVGIAGGGPAGLMLGLLLARAGVRVAVLEKHVDFLRDFRGDTIHPSTMEVLADLGWLGEFLALPHQRVSRLSAQFGGEKIQVADFSHLPVAAPFIAMIPQWDFLDFLARKAAQYDGFSLHLQAEARGLVLEGNRVTGVMAETPQGPLRIVSDLVVAADGRGSTLRAAAGLKSEKLGAPMDVMWFRLPRLSTDTDETQGRFDRGRIFIMLNRGDYWQCAFVIPKGDDARVRAEGLEAFRATVGSRLPFEAARADAISSLSDVKLLNVQIDRLPQWWRSGLLCIGDAAHAMSPVGGVGINLAIQDAVAAANILAEPLRTHRLTDGDLAKVQARREWPTKMTQDMQVTMQKRIIAPALKGDKPTKPPLALRVIGKVPFLSRLPARILGLGFRPERVTIGEHAAA